MKIQTQNRLAHYQCEYNEIIEQTQMLQSQLPALQDQVVAMQQYLNINNGDRKARSDYSKLIQRYNSIMCTINRNQMRLQTLQRQIMCENQKIANQQQKAVLTAFRVKGRSSYGKYTY